MKKRVFSEEWRKNLSLAHKGQTSWRKGKKFVDDETQKARRREYKRKWVLQNKEKIVGYTRKAYYKNIEKSRLRARVTYHKNRENELARYRQQKYGISKNEFDEMLKHQGNSCAVCKNEMQKALCVDHCHTTGKVRGIICSSCNFAIGHSYDSPERLRALANYLEQNA